VRLDHLVALSKLERLSDPQMVNEMRTHMLRADAPTPSVEAILHAILPFKYVDHTHSDATRPPTRATTPSTSSATPRLRASPRRCSRVAALEWGRDGIRINMLHPNAGTSGSSRRRRRLPATRPISAIDGHSVAGTRRTPFPRRVVHLTPLTPSR
jgi:hypothetical protein